VSLVAEFWWGKWDLNPHELPRPLLRRLRLPFRHFPTLYGDPLGFGVAGAAPCGVKRVTFVGAAVER
jgi:hypothetical protein